MSTSAYEDLSLAYEPETLVYRSGMEAPWLKAQLAMPGRSQVGLARFLNLDQAIVNRMSNGGRSIKADEADKIRSYLAATDRNPAANPLAPVPVSASVLPVRGIVEAGSWREVGLSDTAEFLPVPSRILGDGTFALRVAGASMDQHYPDGTFVIVRPWQGGAFPIGKRVVIQRTRPDGLCEATVKELVRAADGELQLWPRSNDPRHQTPVPLADVDGVSVELIGTVVWKMQPEE